MREGSSIFKSLHAASIVNREILHLQKKKKDMMLTKKHSVYILNFPLK